MQKAALLTGNYFCQKMKVEYLKINAFDKHQSLEFNEK